LVPKSVETVLRAFFLSLSSCKSNFSTNFCNENHELV